MATTGVSGFGDRSASLPLYAAPLIGRDRLVAEIAALLGEACRQSDILYSTRILKKTGLRIGRKGNG